MYKRLRKCASGRATVDWRAFFALNGQLGDADFAHGIFHFMEAGSPHGFLLTQCVIDIIT